MATVPRSISASLIVTILVGTAVGALAGLALADIVPDTRLLVIIAGFLAAVAAAIVRYKLLYKMSGSGVDESKIPNVVVVNAAIASLAGSLAAHDLVVGSLLGEPSPVFYGMVAGLFSALLTAMLMIAYHTNPSPQR
jgi:hypothetical protein